ncbi:TIGR04282 family arsenosugar biosynthesis glycosyltransferase [Streptomyces sp. NPDC002004]
MNAHATVPPTGPQDERPEPAADGTGPTTLLVLAKAPVPGRVKTRLCPPYTPVEAARLAEASLVDTLHTVLAAPARRRILVLDGTPGPWLPAGVDVVPQCTGGLDERLAAAFAAQRGPALLIGMDTPQVTPALLAPALAHDAWAGCDAWFGAAEDGGFWALGLAAPDACAELVRGVPMSEATTGRQQLARLLRAGLRVRQLPRLRDVDTAEDAAAVAAAAPAGRFAAALTALDRRTDR